MKLNKLAFIAIVMCVMGATCSAQVLKRTTTKTDSIPFGAGSTLSLTGAPVGDVKIGATSANTVEITATIEVRASNESDLAGAAVLTTFVTQETPGNVSIISVGPDSRRRFTNEEKKLIKRLRGMPYRIDYDIGVPKYCSLQIDAGTGDLTVSGVDGTHKINGIDSVARIAVSGSVSLTLAKGTARIELGGGRVSGIDASVASGDITLVRFHSVSADIEAAVLRSGKIVVDDNALKPRDARKVPFTEKLVQARAGAGGAVIKLTVGDGTISLKPLVI